MPTPRSVFTGSLGGTSDFVFRGLSLTRGKPAAQASLDVEFPQGVLRRRVRRDRRSEPGSEPPVEMDVWAGRYWRMSENFSGDLRLSQYTYPDDPRRVSYNRTEITGTLGFRNQFYRRGYLLAQHQGRRLLAGLRRRQRLGRRAVRPPAAQRALGRSPPASATTASSEVYHDSYNYWNATLTATLAPFELQLAYLGVDGERRRAFVDRSVGDRVALTALWRFSTTR